MSVINTNYLALVSQNNLTKSQNSLGTAIERLSSGLRINSAKDDAAGQAIANRFTANINGLTQAARNANDGISIAQTTEGSLNEINENLQRIRTLTVQATTGSNSDSDLKSIQNEINERLSEINRVSKETQFNGKYVLGADAAKLTVQVGANDNETITIELAKIDSNTLGLGSFDVTKAQSGRPTLGDQVGFNEEFGTIYAIKDNDGAVIADKFAAVGADGSLIAINKAAAADEKNQGYEAAVTFKNAKGADTYGVYAYDAKSAVNGDFSNGTLRVVGYNDGKAYAVTDATDWSSGAPATGELTLSAGSLGQLDNALQKVDDLRSHLGAIQNRFQSTIANLNNTVNNLSAARSRIEDADYAVEVSNMTRAQILQQAGTSVLAQANQVPQTVLSLLR
ncbi:FliC/FljB family flagellin [Alcaligenaceae bacterium 429]|nr:FliC/FljB family flagellin [Alcaligenaceae bacterium 429]